ncbi:hypothetical protein BaRGS_00033165 [Batillaria attramentaria]|uniref:Uncharacterized protein n=1 Tax=Batillaria attramentaria TaxID=370345 RepID=A0ABD0JLN1_9CAEN
MKTMMWTLARTTRAIPAWSPEGCPRQAKLVHYGQKNSKTIFLMDCRREDLNGRETEEDSACECYIMRAVRNRKAMTELNRYQHIQSGALIMFKMVTLKIWAQNSSRPFVYPRWLIGSGLRSGAGRPTERPHKTTESTSQQSARQYRRQDPDFRDLPKKLKTCGQQEQLGTRRPTLQVLRWRLHGGRSGGNEGWGEDQVDQILSLQTHGRQSVSLSTLLALRAHKGFQPNVNTV